MRQLYLMSGSFGAGKTYFCHKTCGVNNTVALASAIRSLLLKCFRGDVRICSTDQDVKNEIFGEEAIKDFIKRERVKGVEKQLFLNFQQNLADKRDLSTVTVRNVLEAFGDAGRKCNKHYWINQTLKVLEQCEGSLLGVDDVRYVNELKALKKWAKKNNIEVIHFFIGGVDDCYENRQLYDLADYYLDWR